MEIQDKIRTIVFLLKNVTFKSLISFIMWTKFCEVAFYFRRDNHDFNYSNLMHLVPFQMGRIKINM